VLAEGLSDNSFPIKQTQTAEQTELKSLSETPLKHTDKKFKWSKQVDSTINIPTNETCYTVNTTAPLIAALTKLMLLAFKTNSHSQDVCYLFTT